MNIIEPLDDQRKEVVPGFSETRRRVLRLPGSIAASIVLARAGNVFGNEVSQETKLAAAVSQLDWAAFQKLCLPVAGELHKDPSAQGQEAYLHWIASMISRTRTSEVPRAKVGRFGKLEPAVSFGVGYRGKPFFIVE